jgi:hemoglobin/transferrin/lactoferrin receptor protein
MIMKNILFPIVTVATVASFLALSAQLQAQTADNVQSNIVDENNAVDEGSAAYKNNEKKIAIENLNEPQHYRRAIEEIIVFGRRDPGERFSVERSNTTLDLDAITERQPSSVFDLVREVPGVNIEGGPRANGSNISIRGMSDNEDLLVLIDGAAKNFEKYRFGRGLQIEPELLKTVSVSRGPATVSQGSGALGGVISMQTKDASDLLRDGHRYGAMLKAGYSDNNDEVLKSVSVYGKPVDWLDVLVNESRRDSNDMELSTGETLPLSASKPKSSLAKFEINRADIEFGTTFSHSEQSGREFFDATANFVGIGGEVYRQTEDDTFTSYFAYQPDNDWVDFHVVYGDTNTSVDEVHLTEPIGLPAVFDYDIKRWSVNNFSKWTLFDDDQWILDVGAQTLSQDRKTSGGVTTQSQQPSGETENIGFYAQLNWEWEGLGLEYGQRRDRNKADVKYAPTIALLKEYGQQTDIDRRDTLETFRVSYKLPVVPVELFAHKTDAIRPPKIDEYFSEGAFSRCATLGSPQIYPTLPDPYQQTGVCGDLYTPEHSDSREFGVVLDTTVFDDQDKLLIKWTHYKNDVKNILESLRTDPFSPATQPGKEYYEGNEFEFAYARGQWELDITYAETDAREAGYFLTEDRSEIYVADQPLYTIPGDLYAATLRWFSQDHKFEAGWRVAHRQGWKGFEYVGASEVIVSQSSNTEHQVFARYSPWEDTDLRLTIDNVTDEEYRLPGGFDGSLGNYNQGRNIRFSWTQYFNF